MQECVMVVWTVVEESRWLVLRCVMSSQVTYGAGVDRSRDLLGSSNVTRAGSSDIVGTWKFRSYVRTAPDTGEYADIMGRHPNGYLIYTPEGRMMVIVVADNREPPKTDEDRIAPHKFMVAYSGRYTVTGGQVVHHVDVSWNQSWTGTDLVRVFKIEDDKPIITTAPTKKYGTDDVQQISTLTLQRVDS